MNMERLTIRLPKGVIKRAEVNDGNKGESIMSRLADYEDTGLDPEQVKALKIASMGRAIAKITEFDGVSIDHLREICEAKAAPGIHGEWEYEHGAWQCSECGKENPYGINYETADFSRYCPGCGAKMTVSQEQAKATHMRGKEQRNERR